jgi:two-component system cell cycle response regulator
VFSVIYSSVVIALAAIVLIALAVTGQFHWSLVLTILAAACVLSEWQVINLPQGDSLTLSIILVLLALVFNLGEVKPPPPLPQAIGALEVIVIGTLVGYGLTHRPPILRLAFYVAHHVLSAAIAGAVFIVMSKSLPTLKFLDSFHVAAVVGYVIVLSFTSMLLVAPINKRIIKEEKLPKADLLYTFLLAPIALVVYYFFESRELDVVSLVILALPLVGVLVTFRLYVNIDTTYGEVNQLYQISQEFVAAMSKEETVPRVCASIGQALSELIPQLNACLIYTYNAEANEYLLVNHDESNMAPSSFVAGHGLLGRGALNRTGVVVNDVTLEDALSPDERQWQPKTAVLAHPMYAEQNNVGLLVLVRAGKGFKSEEFRLVSIVANQAGVTLHNAQMYQRSREDAETDQKLGLLNQTAFSQRAQRLLGRASLSGEPVALLYGDIDDFRIVNNTFGHKTGDDVLVGFARLWKEGAGKSGVACRWGGEELAILLPNTNEQQALETAETLRRTIQDHVFSSDDDREVRVTISTGVAMFPRDAQDIVELVKMADRAQYLAKRSGKNCVRLYQDRKELIEEKEVQPAVPEPIAQERA